MSEIPKPLQVYIVEDSPIIQRLLTAAAMAAGAKVIGCSADAETAIADVFALEPDLIVIDISLASGSGFDVLRALQEHSLIPGAIKVVLTNYASAEYESLSFSMGANGFFNKASDTSQVLALIDALASEKRRRRSLPSDSDHHDSGNHSRK